jgi:hypothetical protein
MVESIVTRGDSAAHQHDPEQVTVPLRALHELVYTCCRLRASLRAVGPLSPIDAALIDHAATVSTSVKAAVGLSRRRRAA